MMDLMILAVALAIDATVVAAARSIGGASLPDALRLAITFGLFQAAMSALGRGIGEAAADWIASWDHWLAFGLLAAVGGKMLLDAAQDHSADTPSRSRPAFGTLLLLAIATSIDALAAGVTLPLLRVPGAVSIASIGLVTFALSLVGAIGSRAIARFGARRLEALGGLTLVAIGLKILIEHLT